ncbi:hypothetical protein M405DRAFT_831407, partial [Rhizopogon salebrosus TDB-379]
DTHNAKSNASLRNSPRTWVTSLIKRRVGMHSCRSRLAASSTSAMPHPSSRVMD